MASQNLYENEELWIAMKDSKYRKLLNELKEKFVDFNNDEQIFVEVLNTVVNAIHAEAGTLWVYDRLNTKKIYSKAIYGGKNLDNISLRLGEGVAGNTIAKNMAVLISDCQKDKRWTGKVDENTGFITKTMICVPLAANGECFGCIQIVNKVDGTLFDDKDYDFTIALGDEISNLFTSNKNKLLDFFFKKDILQEFRILSQEIKLEEIDEEIKKSNLNVLEKRKITNSFKNIYDFLQTKG